MWKSPRPQPQDLPLIGFQNFEAQAAVIQMISPGGHMARDVVEQSRDRRGGFFSASLLHSTPNSSCTFSSETLPRRIRLPSGFTHRIGSRNAIILPNFTDNFLDQVFNRDDARNRTVFIHHDRHLLVSPLHFLQQIRAVLGFRNEEGWAAPVPARSESRISLRELAEGPAQTRSRTISSSESSYTGTRENFVSIRSLRRSADRGAGGNRDDVRPRRHEFQDALVAELDDLLDHLCFAWIEDSLLLRGVHQGFDSLLLRSYRRRADRRRCAPTKSQVPGEPGTARRSRETPG